MSMNQDLNPPPNPSAQVVEGIFGLLQAVADPAAIKKRLKDLVEQTKAANDAVAELAAERAKLVSASANAEEVSALAQQVAARESELHRGDLARQVAAAALADRAAKLDDLKLALDKREQTIGERARAYRDKIEQAKLVLG